MGKTGGVQTSISESMRGRSGRCDSDARICEFMVKGRNRCPARGTQCISTCSESPNSVMGLQERCDARFLRFLANCNFWFLLIPSLCPCMVIF